MNAHIRGRRPLGAQRRPSAGSKAPQPPTLATAASRRRRSSAATGSSADCQGMAGARPAPGWVREAGLVSASCASSEGPAMGPSSSHTLSMRNSCIKHGRAGVAGAAGGGPPASLGRFDAGACIMPGAGVPAGAAAATACDAATADGPACSAGCVPCSGCNACAACC
ncbi:MAG: hypothetical protein J3K34DRAFT_228863 [Monoraphidium minutum]|nr:MAG: hypothetical protein J3K34DRAFT_228863 [Monoraphidium minutum]